MEVILLDSVQKLGTRGQTVKVKPGFARNYLFPRNLALPATDGNKKVFQENERHLIKRDMEVSAAARARAAKLGDLSVSITVQVVPPRGLPKLTAHWRLGYNAPIE